MMKGDKLNQPMHTAGHTLSLQLHPFFPFNHEVTMEGLIISYCTAGLILARCYNVLVHCCPTAGAPNHEDKSLCFPFKLILLSIFYSLSLYHSTNVIMLLDYFFHVAEMLKLTDVIRLEL